MPGRTHLPLNNLRCERSSRKLSGFDTSMQTLAKLQTKLDGVRREGRNLTVMGLDPNQPPDQAALIKELERSARAEMRLRAMALEHAKGKRRFRSRQRRKNAAPLDCRILVMPDRSPGPPI